MTTIRQKIANSIASRGRAKNYVPAPSESITEIFGEKVFNEFVMRDRLPKEIYRQLKSVIRKNSPLDPAVAEIVASTMKNWAIEHGATHFTHWFHPLTGSTAEKHDAFLVPKTDGQALLQFTGKDLIKGEPDASSFPSGGIRGTFEARGYTAWDPTSPAFIRQTIQGATLCIPTAFCSYTGEALDKKTPLLRSQEVLSKYTVEILELLGERSVEFVNVAIGLEQEYFLVDMEYYNQRPDLVACGRTLFGAESHKGQALDDHYFGAIKKRVLHFMQDAEQSLYRLGIPVKTRHNEVAPGQYEIAPVFENANLAIDHNMLLMEVMAEVAAKHKLKFLVHEKPFAGLNGSGKHCNWSLIDSNGNNLLDPGENPQTNILFLTVLTACLRGLDKYAKQIRGAVGFAGNDHRLGANEAPPAILSAYLGDDLNAIVESIVEGNFLPDATESGTIDSGTQTILQLPKDTTDRNRTSPFAFTGNKFEFRALGGSQHAAGPVYVLNTVLAESMDYLATEIKRRISGGADVEKAAREVLRETLIEHKRIVFNGDNYSKEWEEEAEKRGLPNLKTTPDAAGYKIDEEACLLYEKYNVLTRNEARSRYNIKLETYILTLDIEQRATYDIAMTLILPAAVEYQSLLAHSVEKSSGLLGDALPRQMDHLKALSFAIEDLIAGNAKLRSVMESAPEEDLASQADYYKSSVIPAMEGVRKAADQLEQMVDDKLWPLPKYREMLLLS